MGPGVSCPIGYGIKKGDLEEGSHLTWQPDFSFAQQSSLTWCRLQTTNTIPHPLPEFSFLSVQSQASSCVFSNARAPHFNRSLPMAFLLLTFIIIYKQMAFKSTSSFHPHSNHKRVVLQVGIHKG